MHGRRTIFQKLREDSSYDYENAMLNIVPGDIIKFDSYFNAFLQIVGKNTLIYQIAS